MITNPFTRHTINAFCSTGTGGGVDPSCGKVDAKEGNKVSKAETVRLVSKHVQDSHTLSSDERESLAAVIGKSVTSKRQLQRVSTDDAKHAKGSIVDFGPMSFTDAKLTSGGGADHISVKYSDDAVYVIGSPKRGLDVNYSEIETKNFSPSGERETIVAGKYLVAKVARVDHPGRSGNLKVYVLEEVPNDAKKI